MTIITIHPKTQEEISLFEYLAKRLNTPYTIEKDVVKTVKPSDYFGTLSETEGKVMENHINESRTEWERNI